MSIRRLRAARAQAFVLAGVTVCAAIGGCGSSVGPAFDFLPPSGQGALGGSAGDGRVVAVVDGGIADSHPSLEGRVIGRWVADGLDTTPSDHGTMVAGIVAGDAADDFPGGLAPAARLLDAHALDATGTGDPADIASAVRWAVEQGADIIVAAFGSETDHPEIRDAVAEAVAARAVKSYLLNNISASKWTHIMAPKHKWGTVGAKSREQIADLMGKAMADGTHSAYGSGAMQAVLKHQGKTIVVTYSKATGKVSNGWVK